MKSNPKILIIEDDQLLAEGLVKKISMQGYVTQYVTDGAKAVDAIRAFAPDLILLDIVLPNKSGYEILEETSIDPLLKRIPVMVISNSGQPVEINKLLALGIKDYIIKAQFNLDDVMDKIKNLLEHEDMRDLDVKKILNGKKVLWVEDDKLIGDIVAKKFSMINSTLTQMTHGEGAIKYLEDNKPDIAVLDVLMPGMSGYEILKRMKENEATKNIPVIMLSNLGEKSDAERAIKSGAAGYIIKAVMTIDDVLHYMAKILENKPK